MKRLFDIVISFFALVVLLPVLAMIAAAIKLDDNGPVFFRQVRTGKNGKPFRLYKFRSMTLFQIAEEGMFEPGNRSRITRTGKFFREYKLDELPQLINVLKGDMSFVGPRPEVANWITVYPEPWKKILTVKPGITDNASIVFWNEEAVLAASLDPEKLYREVILPRKIELNLEYVETRSFFGDIMIILRTVKTIICDERKTVDTLCESCN